MSLHDMRAHGAGAMQTKYYCFTLNNYTDAELEQLGSLRNDDRVQYIICGQEVGESGTPHIQGYVEFKTRLRLSQVKSIISSRAHFERRISTGIIAAEYCKKDGNFWEHGTLSRVSQGKRTDLEQVATAISSGNSISAIAETFPVEYIKYERGIRSLRRTLLPPRSWKTEVFVLYGEPGTGKTRTAFEYDPGLYTHPGGPWFDGYDGQRVVLFDDFAGSCFRLQYLLKLCDRYPMDVPIKGAFVRWIPRRIYITSNLSIDLWYPNAHHVHVRALRRRLTKVIYFSDFFIRYE